MFLYMVCRVQLLLTEPANKRQAATKGYEASWYRAVCVGNVQLT